jgi:hypothetical protein
MMDNQVSDAETWNLGDIIKDNTNKEWKPVKVGSGETRSHTDSENQLVYDNIGGELVVLQFSLMPNSLNHCSIQCPFMVGVTK